jgi:hypothetical protein
VGLARARRGEKVNCGARIRRTNASSLPEPPEAPPRLLLLPPLPVPSRCRSSATARARVLASSPRQSASATPPLLIGRRRGATGTEPLARFLPFSSFSPERNLRFPLPRPRDSRLPEPFPRRSIAGSVPLCAPRPPRAVEGASAQIRCCARSPFLPRPSPPERVLDVGDPPGTGAGLVSRSPRLGG